MSNYGNRFELVMCCDDDKKGIIDMNNGIGLSNGHIVYQKLSTEEIYSLLNDLNDTVIQLENEVARKEMIKELSEENERLRRCINEIYTIARLEEV